MAALLHERDLMPAYGAPMKTCVLAKIERENNGWTAVSYLRDGIFCRAQDLSEASALAKLRANIENFLGTHGQAWVEKFQYNNSDAHNCPEGAVALPIDAWVCKLVKKACPLQARVLLKERDLFFSCCLTSPERKQQIFETVVKGKYDGFHHILGRSLCPRCEPERKKTGFKYHYPWELTLLQAYFPFQLDQDYNGLRKKIILADLELFVLYSALCAKHGKQLAEQLDPALGKQLVVLEFDFYLR